MSSGSESINIETPEGKISANKTDVPPTPQKITIITGDELKRLQMLSNYGPGFLKTYLSGQPEQTLKNYDKAFRVWQHEKSHQYTDQQVIEILGGYFGNKCVQDLNMECVTVTDENGTEYAIRSKTKEVMGFPFSTVMKRVEDKEYDFLYGVYHTIKQMIDSGEYKDRK